MSTPVRFLILLFVSISASVGAQLIVDYSGVIVPYLVARILFLLLIPSGIYLITYACLFPLQRNWLSVLSVAALPVVIVISAVLSFGLACDLRGGCL